MRSLSTRADRFTLTDPDTCEPVVRFSVRKERETCHLNTMGGDMVSQNV